MKRLLQKTMGALKQSLDFQDKILVFVFLNSNWYRKKGAKKMKITVFYLQEVIHIFHVRFIYIHVIIILGSRANLFRLYKVRCHNESACFLLAGLRLVQCRGPVHSVLVMLQIQAVLRLHGFLNYTIYFGALMSFVHLVLNHTSSYTVFCLHCCLYKV